MDLALAADRQENDAISYGEQNIEIVAESKVIKSSNTTNYPIGWSEHQKKLVNRILSLLDGNLGSSPIPPSYFSHWPTKSTLYVALLASTIYILLFCGIQYVIGEYYYGSYNKILILLSIWGSCYLGFCTITAKNTTKFVNNTIYYNVIPELTDDTAAAITTELDKQFDEGRIHKVSLAVAAVAALASAFVLIQDLNSFQACDNEVLLFLLKPLPGGKNSMPGIGEIVIWALGFFILYLVSARVTDVARFYCVFAKHLEPNALFTLDPAHSALVADIASIGRRILFFWFGIGLSVVTLIPFFYQLQRFIILVVVVATYFSIVNGTIVFLSTEREIRRVVQIKISSTLTKLEKEVNQLFAQCNNISSSEREFLTQLKSMHKELSTAQGYHSYLLSILSLLSPLLGPVVAVVAIFADK